MPKCTSQGVKRNKKGIEVQVGEFFGCKKCDVQFSDMIIYSYNSEIAESWLKLFE